MSLTAPRLLRLSKRLLLVGVVFSVAEAVENKLPTFPPPPPPPLLKAELPSAEDLLLYMSEHNHLVSRSLFLRGAVPHPLPILLLLLLLRPTLFTVLGVPVVPRSCSWRREKEAIARQPPPRRQAVMAAEEGIDIAAAVAAVAVAVVKPAVALLATKADVPRRQWNESMMVANVVALARQ